MLDFSKWLTRKQSAILAFAALVFFASTVGRLNIEKWAEEKGYDKLLLRWEGPVWDLITAIWRFLASDIAIGIAIGVVGIGFWPQIQRGFARGWAKFRGREAPAPEEVACPPTTSADQIERNRLNDRMRTLNRATHLLVYSEIERILAARMRARVYDEPLFADDDVSISETEMKERTAALRQYVHLVESNLAMSKWAHDLDFAIQSAEAEEEQRLKSGVARAGVNAYVYRDYAIALKKARYAASFLRRALAEHDDALSATLSRMREEIQRLDPRTFS